MRCLKYQVAQKKALPAQTLLSGWESSIKQKMLQRELKWCEKRRTRNASYLSLRTRICSQTLAQSKKLSQSNFTFYSNFKCFTYQNLRYFAGYLRKFHRRWYSCQWDHWSFSTSFSIWLSSCDRESEKYIFNASATYRLLRDERFVSLRLSDFGYSLECTTIHILCLVVLGSSFKHHKTRWCVCIGPFLELSERICEQSLRVVLTFACIVVQFASKSSYLAW